jgi:tRNA A37 methylthiotransferase MiaB
VTANRYKTVLVAINAKYIHTCFGVRYLQANLQDFEPESMIQEFTIQERATDIAEKILASQPECVAFSCYVWNITLVDEVVRIIRSVRPRMIIVLGGPEVSYPDDLPPVATIANHIICGEGEVALVELLNSLRSHTPMPRIISGAPVDLTAISLPYHLYSDEDIKHRVVYVESSRGCAFGCEFCLSSMDKQVCQFEPKRIINALDNLWQRGVRHFKFIDRTIHFSKAAPILDFFMQRICPELFLHFEIVPDRISDDLIDTLSCFPKGAVQLEAGVQTFNPEVSARIGRKQNMEKTEANIRRIVNETGVHIHSDLVVGLPGESIESLAAGFDRLLQTRVHEIQVGILKRLRGAPIARHTDSFQMVYRHAPPYDILQNNLIPFEQMQRLKRFSRYFDLVVNNGNFKETAPLLWHSTSPFASFLAFSDWLFLQSNRTAGIALDHLAEYIFDYLVSENHLPAATCADTIQRDFQKRGRRRLPKCVREFASSPQKAYSEAQTGSPISALPERQRRHNQ